MVFVFCLQRIALECQIPTRVASVATQGAMPKWQAEGLFHHTCLITRNSSNSAKELKNSTKHTAHQYRTRQRHQRNNGANSVSGTNGASCNTESDSGWARPSGRTAAASRMAYELEDICVRSPLPVTARIHRKRIGASSGTMYHTIKHSSVKQTLRCIHIMHLVCCVGE